MKSKNSFMSSESSMSMALVRKSAISQTENLKTKGFDLSPWLLALEEEFQPVRKWTWDYCTSPGLGASPSPRSSVVRFKSPRGWGVIPAGVSPGSCSLLPSSEAEPKGWDCPGPSRVLCSHHGLQEGGHQLWQDPAVGFAVCRLVAEGEIVTFSVSICCQNLL